MVVRTSLTHLGRESLARIALLVARNVSRQSGLLLLRGKAEWRERNRDLNPSHNDPATYRL